MNITSAEFIKGIVGDDDLLMNGIPQVAFIGRSNVGKSSVINSLVKSTKLVKSSPKPGLTKVLNVFFINRKYYLIDLPGYGFAQGSHEDRAGLRRLIDWYFFGSDIEQKAVVLIIDAKVGLTDLDREMLEALIRAQKKVVVVVNKIDKLKQGELNKQLKAIGDEVHLFEVIPYSAKERIGVEELSQKVFND